MTTRPPAIRILSERRISTFPRAGEELRQVSITYQIPPLPPNVLFVAESDLPDYVWRNANPTAEKVPDAVQKAGDARRRDLILGKGPRAAPPTPRSI